MKRGNIKFQCKHCGKESLVFPADVRKGGGIFCSLVCRVAYKKATFDRKAWHAAWYQKNKEHVKKRDAERERARQEADPQYAAAKTAKRNAQARRRHAANPERGKATQRRYQMKYPKRFQNWHYKKKYGLTADFVRSEIEAQDNRCKLCNEEFPKTPHVDHDHDTGKYRAMLDFDCNRGLGSFDDDPALLFKAFLYLVDYKNIPTIS